MICTAIRGNGACSAEGRDLGPVPRRHRLPAKLIVVLGGPGRIVAEPRVPVRRIGGLERDGVVLVQRVIRGRRQVVQVAARDARGGGLARLAAGSSGRDRPGPRQLVVRVGGPRPRGSSRQAACRSRSLCLSGGSRVVQASRQVPVVDLFLDQPILERPALFLELGDLGLELLVLELEMAHRGLHLAGRGPSGQHATASRAPRHHHQTP